MEEIFSKVRKSTVEPVRLSLNTKFKFRCRVGISCFTKCCGELDIFLTPYDILTIKNRLNISSGEFILKYTEPVILQRTRIPFIKLKLQENGRCNFVTEDGCTIYPHRPVACRYYPLGHGLIKSKEVEDDDFYFFVKEDFCTGFLEDKEWDVKSWKEDQGIDIYDEMNQDWSEIVVNKKLFGASIEPDEKSLKMFFMGSYDIDSFREFVLESRFTEVFDISSEEMELIKKDESELMKLGLKWLKYVLFKEPTMKLKKGVKGKKSKKK